ncbi:MAG TPA: MerR family transcriptional regulator [Nitrospiria bacterium]|nr:MerR family transcriptional regulator [Nitrospiria bacterium]
MKTNDLLKQIDIPRHKLYYLEQKGYVTPTRIPMGDLEAREYSTADVELVAAIWKYLKKGFKHRVAYEKALDDIGRVPPVARRVRRREAA